MELYKVRWSIVRRKKGDVNGLDFRHIPSIEGWCGNSDEVNLSPGEYLELLENGSPESWAIARLVKVGQKPLSVNFVRLIIAEKLNAALALHDCSHSGDTRTNDLGYTLEQEGHFLWRWLGNKDMPSTEILSQLSGFIDIEDDEEYHLQIKDDEQQNS